MLAYRHHPKPWAVLCFVLVTCSLLANVGLLGNGHDVIRPMGRTVFYPATNTFDTELSGTGVATRVWAIVFLAGAVIALALEFWCGTTRVAGPASSPDQKPLLNSQPLEEMKHERRAIQYRTMATIFTNTAFVLFVLSAVGIYSSWTYSAVVVAGISFMFRTALMWTAYERAYFTGGWLPHLIGLTAACFHIDTHSLNYFTVTILVLLCSAAANVCVNTGIIQKSPNTGPAWNSFYDAKGIPVYSSIRLYEILILFVVVSTVQVYELTLLL